MLALTACAPTHRGVAVAHRIEQVLGQRLRAGVVAHARQHEELVAAEAADGVFRAHRGLQGSCHAGEQAVAFTVSERVVDRLEAVEIDEEQRHRLGLRACQRKLQAIHHRAPAQRAGHRVAFDAALQLLTGQRQVVHVDRHRVKAHDLPVGIEIRHVARAHPAHAAIGQLGEPRVVRRLAGQRSLEVRAMAFPALAPAHFSDVLADQHLRGLPGGVAVRLVDEAQHAVAVAVGERVRDVFGEAIEASPRRLQRLALLHVVVDVEGDREHRFDVAAGIAIGEDLHARPSWRPLEVHQAALIGLSASFEGRRERRSCRSPRRIAVQLGERAADELFARPHGPGHVRRVAEQQPALTAPAADRQIDGIDQPPRIVLLSLHCMIIAVPRDIVKRWSPPSLISTRIYATNWPRSTPPGCASASASSPRRKAPSCAPPTGAS